jgi:hypothetical protein
MMTFPGPVGRRSEEQPPDHIPALLNAWLWPESRIFGSGAFARREGRDREAYLDQRPHSGSIL